MLRTPKGAEGAYLTSTPWIVTSEAREKQGISRVCFSAGITESHLVTRIRVFTKVLYVATSVIIASIIYTLACQSPLLLGYCVSSWEKGGKMDPGDL